MKQLKSFQNTFEFDTTNPPGHEAKVARFFAKIFDKEKIPTQTYESKPGRVSKNQTDRGLGKKGQLFSMIYHGCGFSANSNEYTFDSFGGEINRRVYLWTGRIY